MDPEYRCSGFAGKFRSIRIEHMLGKDNLHTDLRDAGESVPLAQ